jgi:hypothetical protein
VQRALADFLRVRDVWAENSFLQNFANNCAPLPQIRLVSSILMTTGKKMNEIKKYCKNSILGSKP